ncbi:PREDICTED: zinc finger protein 853-like [Dufourea novaeangliae]|uniref:zinc finger protein 853-like n=1 Tax=Dufourea novaeangliae TaxID=178035 RepID=UPI000766FBCF|nr:PREDICTED: zinc finger protein 853-like [Dufourea novaeangliae]
MSGYRRVNYYELCRLCTSSEGNKMNIFRDEGRRRQLQSKIQTCLPVQVLEEDSLPKVVCHDCVKKLENFIEFRETVVSAEGMLESYFTSLRFSEDFLKEGKVYVKSTEKDRPTTPENDVLKSIEKVSPAAANQIVNNDQPIQHQQPVVVSNINASNIQIISGVQARVQQYKCAMQMQPGGMAAAVVEATAETHYSYQQQTSQQVSPQSNDAQNQITEQHSPASQIQQVQGQIQSHGQMNQQIQPQRQITQQMNQSAPIPQQQNQTQVGQQQQNQSQITQQIQQLQRQQREFEKQQQRQLQHIEKQQVQINAQQEFPIKQEPQGQVVHQNNNVILKTEPEAKQNQPIIQKVQSDPQKDDNGAQSVQAFAAVHSSPEVFLNLGFKESPLVTQTVREDAKEFKTDDDEDAISRNSIGQISEFLRIKSGPEPTSLITVNPQVITQSRDIVCKDCDKTFTSVNQLNSHSCAGSSFNSRSSLLQTLLTDATESEIKEDPLQTNNNSFSCNVCGKPFKRREHLYQHRKLHTGERPFVCTTCAKAFSRKEHLVRHSVSHTGEKMHECEMCGKSFSRKDNLHKHRKTHGVSGPYICETCGKSFVVKHYYLMHLTTHATTTGDGGNCQDPLPYKCDLCHKAFSVKQYLTTHKLRHRSKNSNNSGQNSVNGQQQTQQTNTTNNVNIVSNNVASSGPLNGNNGQSNNGSTVEIESVIEKTEEPIGSFDNQYHNNIQEFQ